MLRNVSASPLPFIGTEAPVLWFYVLMPLIITSLYVFLISSIGRLWKMLQQLPAIFPDGSDLTMMPYCWILTDAARQTMPLLRMHSKNQRIAQNSLQSLILFSLPIFSLLMFWWYYIPLRNEAVTWLHVFLITVCLLITFIFFYGSIWNRTFNQMKRGIEKPRIDSQQHTRSAILQQVVLPLVSVLMGVSLATIVYFISFKVFDANADRTALEMNNSCPPDASLQLLCQMKHRSYIDVRYKALSSRPSDWNDPANIADIEWGGGEEDAAKIRRFFGPVDGVDLRAFNLSYADAQYTFLAKARLEDAILDRADLKFADLRLAYMDRAQAKGAYLSRADLRRARLIGANLEGAFLDDADLSGALLQAANLTNACLRGANLTGVHMRGAVLEGADITDASFNINTITKEQLATACADGSVELPAKLAGETIRACTRPENKAPCIQ